MARISNVSGKPSGQMLSANDLIPAWSSGYPERSILKAEVEDMVRAFTEVLLDQFRDGEIEGIYLKGSAQKEWDSPVDYVPELSDVDMHVLVQESSDAEKILRDPLEALRIQSKVEEVFFSKNAEPTHVPRPQVFLLNMFQQDENYIPSPRSTVRVLYGRDYPEADYSDVQLVRKLDCARLREGEKHLSGLGLSLVDKPGKYVWTPLRNLSWHVSPAGPRILSLLGAPPEDAWSMNRTSIVRIIEKNGDVQLARNYAGFYLHGWEYFLSGLTESSAARSALSSGIKVLSRGVEISEAWACMNPEVC